MERVARWEELTEATRLLWIAAPEVARRAQPGQMVGIRVLSEGAPDNIEYILPLVEWDVEGGLIAVVVPKGTPAGASLGTLEAGTELSVSGPLGSPFPIQRYGTVVCVGVDWGAAVLRHLVQALSQAENYVVSLIGIASKDHLFWQEEFCWHSNHFAVAVQNGHNGQKPSVEHMMAEWLTDGERADLVVLAGPEVAVGPLRRRAEAQGVPVVVLRDRLIRDV